MTKKMKRIISLLLIAICLFTTLETSPLTVHATGANANGGGNTGVGTTTGVMYGASENKCGYRFYIIDKYANSVSSHAVDLVYPSVNYEDLLKDLKSGVPYFCDNSTRICNLAATDTKYMLSDMPKPYYYENGKFVGNGQALRAWAISPNSDGYANILKLILYAFGDKEGSEGMQIVAKWKANQDRYYAVLEPITWHGFFMGGESSTRINMNMYGTFYNWYKDVYSKGILKNGNFTSLLDMFVLGTCMTLERDTDFEAFEGETYELKKPTFSPSAKSDEQIGSAGKELSDLGFGKSFKCFKSFKSGEKGEIVSKTILMGYFGVMV